MECTPSIQDLRKELLVKKKNERREQERVMGLVAANKQDKVSGYT